MSVILESQSGDEFICIQEFYASPDGQGFSWYTCRQFKVGEHLRYAGYRKESLCDDRPGDWMVIFDKERNMTLTHVGPFLPEGLRALPNLLNMLVEAAACKVAMKKAPGWENIGITLDGRKYWLGVNYEEPDELWFGTRCRIDPDAATRLGVGEVTEETWVPGRYRWWRGVALNSEAVHFYSRSKVGQMEWLESFLRDCLTTARSIETADQPPIPEEPEGT